MESTVGSVELTWGINRWVLIAIPAGEIQRQVGSWSELARVFDDLGMSPDEADRIAKTFWASRPAGAGLGSPRTREAAWRSTGLPAFVVFLILLAAVAVLVLGLYLFFRSAG